VASNLDDAPQCTACRTPYDDKRQRPFSAPRRSCSRMELATARPSLPCRDDRRLKEQLASGFAVGQGPQRGDGQVHGVRRLSGSLA
jgi:hypothetical protein